MRIVLAGLLAFHGLIHVLGFVAGFALAQVPELKMTIGRLAGMLWLAASGLFIAAAMLAVAEPRVWWVPAALGLVLSQWLIVQVWRDAKLGSLINVALLIPVGIALMAQAPGSFQWRFRQAVAPLAVAVTPAVITDAQLQPLPPPVQAWLRGAGVVGKPAVHHVRAAFKGQIRAKADGPWMPFTAVQYDFFDRPARYFLLEASMVGVPFEALHVYAGGEATMQVKAASLVTMADVRGEQLSRSETVTFFNDMCVLAPATLVDPAIRWEEVDATHAKATFTHAGHTVSALLTFGPDHRLIDFTSGDRLQTEDGTRYESYPWSTPLSDVQDFAGVRLPRRGDAQWATPTGALVYGHFELVELTYNGGRQPL